MNSQFWVKKPIPVEAYQWDGSVNFKPTESFTPEIRIGGIPCLSTAEGFMELKPGSYIVKGPAGEYWAVRQDIFENTYEPI